MSSDGRRHSAPNERTAKTLADLRGDPVEDDAILAALPDITAALEPLLATLTPAVDGQLVQAVCKAYFRWKGRRRRPPQDRVAVTIGALGFWLITMRMLQCTAHIGKSLPDDRSWDRLQWRLNRVFKEPEVLKFFATLYQFPTRQLRLRTASIHMLGSTSFILECSTWNNQAPAALKCLLYPYTKNEEISAATEGYFKTYQGSGAHMVHVHRSTGKWIWMDFVEGKTLAQVLRMSVSSRDEIRDTDSTATDESMWKSPPARQGATQFDRARLAKYGVPLLDALAKVPHAHLDLAPSNIMVCKAPTDLDGQGRADIVLIDFGRNYLHTQALGAGLSSDSARYVAPEELHSELAATPSGYEDVYSAGQILLEIAGYRQGGGYIPKELYMEAPFLGRLFEDMLDDDPAKRLLLLDKRPPGSVDAESQAAVFGELRDRVIAGLEASEIMSRITPTLAIHQQDEGAPRWLQLLRRLRRWGSLPLMLSTVQKPLEFLEIAEQRGPASKDFSYFFKWAAACSFCWMIVWVVTVSYLANDLVHGTFRPALPDVLQQGFPPINFELVRQHYSTLLPGWENLPGRLVALTFGITAARYYLEIFGMQRARSPLLWKSVLTDPFRIPLQDQAEWLMRLNAVWIAPLVLIGNIWFVRHWLLFAAFALLPIVANNYVCWRLTTQLADDGAKQFSTVRRSDLRDAISAYGEWWKLMAWYAAMLGCVGILTEMGLASDIWVYALVVIALNMIKLYRSNCGKLAPALRANLSRAFVAGERLDKLKGSAQDHAINLVAASGGAIQTTLRS